MSSSILGDDGQKSFHALINSLVPETTSQGGGKLTPEAAEKLSEKLKELVGEEAAKDFEHRRNERGELVNEEGLPIIEISEPIPQHEEPEPQDEPVIYDVPLIKLSSLPSVAREKLRRQRDRILDTLEEEERQDDERQERAEREEREEILRKRKEEARNETARLQKAKEFQKKMGKAFLRDTESSGKEADTSHKEGGLENSQAENTQRSQKTVTFVETSNTVSDRSEPEWNDVTPARLRSGQRPTLLQAFRPDTSPVKFTVVERKPAALSSADPTPNRPIPLAQSSKDSDDESEPEDADLQPASDNGEDDKTLVEELPDSESEEDDGEVELENEYDLDYAQHQREIALEYYHKRNTIGQDSVKAMMEHTHEDELNNDSVSESPAPNTQSKPSVSRFKANRIASAYGVSASASSSISIGESALPESSTRTIQRSIRSGRIDERNHLVGGDHDSDSEIEAEGLQEALDLFRKGEVYNLGPSGQYLYAPPQSQSDAAITSSAPRENTRTHTSAALSPHPVAEQQGPRHGSLPPLNRPKTSKFKADRSQSGRPSAMSRSETQPPTTTAPSVLSDTITEKMHGKPQAMVAPEALQSSYTSPPSASNPPLPMVIDSPSFTAPGIDQSRVKSSMSPFTSMIIESPSFPSQPTRGIAPELGTAGQTFQSSIIVESPSFPPTRKGPRRPDRPPAVVSSQSLTHSSTAIPGDPGGFSPSESSHPVVSRTVLERVSPVPRDNKARNNPSTTSDRVSKFKQSKSSLS